MQNEQTKLLHFDFADSVLIGIAFIGFALTVAIRDVIFRYSFSQGVSFSEIATLTGFC